MVLVVVGTSFVRVAVVIVVGADIVKVVEVKVTVMWLCWW